ncbi:hypothetical protein SN15_02760 [Stenotrophomonas maltophilia]|nr:hypothetical protein SN15_02760 [Stenotrophomonas maltophilia]
MSIFGGILSFGIALAVFSLLFAVLMTFTALIIGTVRAAMLAVAALFRGVSEEPYMDNVCPDCRGVEGCSPHCPASAADDAAAPARTTEHTGQGFKALSRFDRRK